MNPPDIATLDLIAIHADGTRIPVALRVGAPQRAHTGEWQCTVSLDGLHDRLVPIRGEDSVQALCLALGFAATLLRTFVAGGGRLVATTEGDHSATGLDWPLEAYFGWLGTPRAADT